MAHHARFSPAGDGAKLRAVDVDLVVKIDAADTDGVYEIFELAGSRGTGAPMARHPWPEAYHGIDGEFDVRVGGRRHVLSAHATVAIPPNAAHSLTVTSDHARMLVISLGGSGGRFFADLDREVDIADGPDVFVPAIGQVAERHHVTLVTPSGTDDGE